MGMKKYIREVWVVLGGLEEGTLKVWYGEIFGGKRYPPDLRTAERSWLRDRQPSEVPA